MDMSIDSNALILLPSTLKSQIAHFWANSWQGYQVIDIIRNISVILVNTNLSDPNYIFRLLSIKMIVMVLGLSKNHKNSFKSFPLFYKIQQAL